MNRKKPAYFPPRIQPTDEPTTFDEGRAALYVLVHLFEQEDLLSPLVMMNLREIAVLLDCPPAALEPLPMEGHGK